ncbi:Putative Remark: the ORF contains a PWI motif [Penicillium brasilianum]|uniref:Putative Remark: the ORF contains a PWI motif n=1 Tax=Penicillium brasilianum TaxID=104259 RepID=A0A0F7TL69_PENBI|nr:Putative Remark: the ORF contains a PWI motif [Penicillium brasilianum]
MATPVDAKLLKKTKFPPEFNRKVDMTKVNIEVMKKWIAKRISDILGNEDDVVIELCFNLLEGSRYPDIKALQIQLTGFLDKDTPKFCKELWSLCLSGQENPQGVPKELLEAKKLELMQEKIEAERAAEAVRREKEQERIRERELNDMRRRERSDRGDRNFGGRRSYNRRRSRSPLPQYGRYRHRESPPRRDNSFSYPSDRPDRTPPRGRSSSRSPPRFRRPTRTPPAARSSSRSPQWQTIENPHVSPSRVARRRLENDLSKDTSPSLFAKAVERLPQPENDIGEDEKVARPRKPEQQPNIDDAPGEGHVGADDARTTIPLDKSLVEIRLTPKAPKKMDGQPYSSIPPGKP